MSIYTCNLVFNEMKKDVNGECMLTKPYHLVTYNLYLTTNSTRYPEMNPATRNSIEINGTNSTIYVQHNDNPESTRLYNFGIIDHDNNDKWWSSRPAVITEYFNIELVEVIINHCVYYMEKNTVLGLLPEGYALVKMTSRICCYGDEARWCIIKSEDIKKYDFYPDEILVKSEMA